MKKPILAAICCATASSVPAAVTPTATGFATDNTRTVKAAPAAVWAALVQPARYWNPAHSYSGKSANLSLSPTAGGCFCETLDDGGSVEHARVVLVMPNRLLRLSGALGPLQAEGVAATLTWTLKPLPDGGTEIGQTYVVGGLLRMPAATIGPPVDGVVREQLDRLAAAVGN